MAAATLRTEERIGLVVALAAHAGLVAWLALWQPVPEPLPMPEKVSVTLSDEVGLVATTPEPLNDPAPDAGPEAGEAPPPPAPLIQPAPQPTFAPKPLPQPVARPVPPPKPVARPVPPRRDQIADLLDRRPPPRTAPPRTAPPRTAPPKPGTGTGSTRFADAFSKGVPGASGAGAPPATIGPAERSALASAIARQLKPKWVAPQGADAEKLITILSWDINPDGTLSGAPRVVRQDGITDANRAQAQRHAEQAIRAVKLAAPFNLPRDLYSAWKRVANFRFDRRLSQ